MIANGRLAVFMTCLLMAANLWAAPINLAYNPTRSGLPSPLSSDHGWGGGSDIWSIVDGRTSYDSWANGLAFTGGIYGWGGEPGGIRQATIDFGTPVEFDEVMLWWHGVRETPKQVDISYWSDSLLQWVVLDAVRTYGAVFEPGTNAGYAHSDQYLFSPVAGSRVRASFDNRGQAIDGSQMVHGWLYEVSVYDNPESVAAPGTLLLTALGLTSLGLGFRRRPLSPAES